MPNWCHNKVEVTPLNGDIVSFQRFRDTLLISEQGEITFHLAQTLPLPEEERLNWYDWQCENWGTKWDVSDAECIFGGGSFVVLCDTAWEPPLAWAKGVAGKYGVKITIDYEEPNECFGGHAVATPEGLDDECWNIIYPDEDMDISNDEDDPNPQMAAAA